MLPFAEGANVAPEALREIRTLRSLVIYSLMALVLMGTAVNIFLWGQFWMVRKELVAIDSFLEDYQKHKEPLLNSFVTRLQGFAQTHPDLLPILDKYGVRPAAPGPTSPPASLPPSSGGKKGP